MTVTRSGVPPGEVQAWCTVPALGPVPGVTATLARIFFLSLSGRLGVGIMFVFKQFSLICIESLAQGSSEAGAKCGLVRISLTLCSDAT